MYVLFRVAVKLQSTAQLLMSRPWKIISRDCRVRNKRIYFPSFHSSCSRISLPQFKYSNTFPVLNHKGRLRRLTVQKWKWKSCRENLCLNLWLYRLHVEELLSVENFFSSVMLLCWSEPDRVRPSSELHLSPRISINNWKCETIGKRSTRSVTHWRHKIPREFPCSFNEVATICLCNQQPV